MLLGKIHVARGCLDEVITSEIPCDEDRGVALGMCKCMTSLCNTGTSIVSFGHLVTFSVINAISFGHLATVSVINAISFRHLSTVSVINAVSFGHLATVAVINAILCIIISLL